MFRPVSAAAPVSVAAIIALIAACSSSTNTPSADEPLCNGGCLCFPDPATAADCGFCSLSQSVEPPGKLYCNDGIAPCNIGFTFGAPADAVCNDRSKPLTPAGAPDGGACYPPPYPVTDAAAISDGATE